MLLFGSFLQTERPYPGGRLFKTQEMIRYSGRAPNPPIPKAPPPQGYGQAAVDKTLHPSGCKSCRQLIKEPLPMLEWALVTQLPLSYPCQWKSPFTPTPVSHPNKFISSPRRTFLVPFLRSVFSSLSRVCSYLPCDCVTKQV